MGVDYDVIIAGAGPAGGECARYLAKNSKCSVLLLDKTQEIGEPKKSTAGTFVETMKVFKLPKKVVMAKINSVVLEGPTVQAVKKIDGYVLEFGRLKKFLVEDAVHAGAELKINATVSKPVLENGKVVGIEYQDMDGLHTAKAKIVIDATGPTAALATQLGLRTLNPKEHWIGMEFEMERLNLPVQNAMVLRLDDAYAPGGYSWIFSTGKNHAKVGNCWSVDIFKKKGGASSQVAYLEKWIKSDARLKKGVSMEVHAGDAYYSQIKQRSTDNFIAIGDSVSSINQLFGEGIRPCMYSGMFAAKTAILGLKKKDTSAKMLSNYDQEWWENIGKYRKVADFLTNKLYRLPNNWYDRIAKNVGKLSEDEVRRFIGCTFTLKDAAKVLL